MSATVFLAADIQLSIERAGRRCNDIAAQHSQPFSCLYKFFVGERSDKCSVLVFVEFTETDWAEHRDAHGWSAEEGERILARL
jgi:hypothetical protein